MNNATLSLRTKRHRLLIETHAQLCFIMLMLRVGCRLAEEGDRVA